MNIRPAVINKPLRNLDSSTALKALAQTPITNPYMF